MLLQGKYSKEWLAIHSELNAVLLLTDLGRPSRNGKITRQENYTVEKCSLRKCLPGTLPAGPTQDKQMPD